MEKPKIFVIGLDSATWDPIRPWIAQDKQLSKAGCKVGTINVPFTYPPEQVQGFPNFGYGYAF
jgi:predicted AlkP superfamily phosphohydrolase/phosphomutase